MVPVMVTALSQMTTFVYANMGLMVLTVNSIIGYVNPILVGIMVFSPSALRFFLTIVSFLFIGVCNETSNTTFSCLCAEGWEGDHCETQIDYCTNVICQNNGVCRSSLLNFTCECLGDSYSGRYCEITATDVKIREVAVKSVAYVAILSLLFAGSFIILMDILTYGFGIDPVKIERKKTLRRKQLKKRKPVIQRFIYIPAPPAVPQSK